MVNRFMTSGDPAPRGDARAEMRLLGSVPTFAHASAALLSRVVDAGHVVTVRPNWPLLCERTAPEKAYVLLDGEVEVHRGREQLGRFRAGEILGELSIVRRCLRSATVVTAAPTTVLHLDRATFEELYAEEDYVTALVDEAIHRRVV